MGLTKAIGEFTAAIELPAIPAAAIPTVAAGFTDCVGVLLAGLNEPAVRTIAAGIEKQSDGEAAAFLDFAARTPELALLYGAAAHVLDFDDTGLSGHPSAVLVPAILAEAQETAADGRAMIAAYVAGYEIWAELIGREADQHHSKGWHPTAVFGAVAAAGASAVLRKLDAGRAAHAIGIAASMASGVVANFGSMTKPFQVGHAAQSGLIAARWAERGMTAAADAIEHDLGFLRAISPRGSVDTGRPVALGKTWRIVTTGLNIKLYPICYSAHRALDAMIDLRRLHDFQPGAIEAIEVELGDGQAAVLRNHAPQTSLEAKFSIEFAMAAGAIAGHCGNAQLANDFLSRPDVRSLFDKVSTKTTSERNADEPTLAPFDRVRVVADGRTFESEPVYFPRGHFRNPIGKDVLAAKFKDCTSAALPESRAQALFEKLQNLKDVRFVRDFG
jgi:2-methylcitrate dehydratase PrpD